MFPGLHFSFSQPSKSKVLRGMNGRALREDFGLGGFCLPSLGLLTGTGGLSQCPAPALSTGTATGAPHIPTHFHEASPSSTSPGGANYDDVNEAEVLMLPWVLMTFLQVFCYFSWRQEGGL